VHRGFVSSARVVFRVHRCVSSTQGLVFRVQSGCVSSARAGI
jgi:hypothetical protein